MIRRLGVLIGGCLGLWLLAVLAAWLLEESAWVTYSTVAALLCLVPTAVTLLWSELALAGSPEQQLAAVMGGTVARMAFVMGAGLLLSHKYAALSNDKFWLWIIGFYLATLALEVAVVVGRPAAASRSEKP